MGPIRRMRKKRMMEKRAEREAAALLASGPQEPSDWWDDFSKRFTGGPGAVKMIPKTAEICPKLHEKLLGINEFYVYQFLGSSTEAGIETFYFSLYEVLTSSIFRPWDPRLLTCVIMPFSLSSLKGADKFESVFKISRKTFDHICSLVSKDLTEKPTNFTCKNGKVLSVYDQVAIALRRLSSGESLLNVGQSLGVNQSTVSQVTWRFVEAMEEKGMDNLKWPNPEEMETIKSKFEKILGLPNCCGVIDTTHIMMCLPVVDSSNDVWIDNEKNHSMVLQAIVDPEMKFRDIVTGWPGSITEYLTLRNSGFFKLCENSTRLNGKKMSLSKELEVRECIIGDEGYPLLPWLLTPYNRGRALTDSEAEFNKRLQATSMVAQRALARLKDMWKIVQGEMWRPDKHRLPRILLVCCLLHNIIIDCEDAAQDKMPLSHKHDERYKQRYCHHEEEEASVMRNKLSRYLSGRLPP